MSSGDEPPPAKHPQSLDGGADCLGEFAGMGQHRLMAAVTLYDPGIGESVRCGPVELVGHSLVVSE